ncbi:MAG: asparagine--tRNA ligase [Eubacteriales bacterium]|nr:asparagine--tRNA ligase [Eubacteriales bacterium]
MENLVYISDIYREPEAYTEGEIRVGGWQRTLRDQKSFAFLDLRDGTDFRGLQIILTPEALENYKELAHAGNGAALICTGSLKLTPEGKQPFELHASKVEIEGKSPADYPLQPKRHSPEFLRTIPHLRPRSNLFQAVFRLRSVLAFTLHEFFQKRGFVYAQTPIISFSDGEGAGEMFTVTNFDLNHPAKTDKGEVDFSEDFFARKAQLTVTGQMEGEAMAQAFRNIYTFGPTFRAENSNTVRHAAEFWMLEPELAFADLDDVIACAEDMLKYTIKHALEACPVEFEFFNNFVEKGLIERLEKLVNAEFVRMTYTEAIAELKKAETEFSYLPEWGDDLQSEHERYICEKVIDGPVFVTDYPKDIKAFYMKQNEDGKTVAATDLLVPYVGEIIGGSQREESEEKLRARIRELGMKESEYEWYLALRRYGSTRHGGFGLGFERLLMYLTGVKNIRDVQIFPRTKGFCI